MKKSNPLLHKNPQNSISDGYFTTRSESINLKKSINEVYQKTGFTPLKKEHYSTFWGSKKIGAYNVEGTLGTKPAVLKLQLIKPQTSEVTMIQACTKATRGISIRPPEVYAHIPWSNSAGYEAFIMEHVSAKPLIEKFATEKTLNDFFSAFILYRNHCRNNPWIIKPEKTLSQTVKAQFAQWQTIRNIQYPDHPFVKTSDLALVEQAVTLLAQEYESVEMEFVHGHLSVHDIRKQNDDIILLSNLYWSYRAPFYDAVFAYHWHILTLHNIVNITAKEIDAQRALWISHIRALPYAADAPSQRLITLALLERSAAALNLDLCILNTQRPIASFIYQSTRKEIKKLMNLL